MIQDRTQDSAGNTSQHPYALGILGVGHMGKAIVEGLIQNPDFPTDRLALCTHQKASLAPYAEKGVAIFDTAQDLANQVDLLIVAVKPQAMDATLAELKGTSFRTLVSLAAGLSLAYYQAALGKPTIRLMPNLPLAIQAGATAMSHTDDVLEEDLQEIQKLFGKMGMIARIPDEQMHDIIVVNGSTPAYVFYFLKLLIDDAVRRGVDPQVAKDLLMQTFVGATEYAKASPESLDTLIQAVCSKGGTTIEAISSFQDAHLEQIFQAANEACVARSKVLGK